MTEPGRSKQNTRSHALVSCIRCRRNRRKCDDSYPSCGPCLKADTECLTYDRVLKRNIPRNYIEMLEERNKGVSRRNDLLEQKLKELSSIHYEFQVPKVFTKGSQFKNNVNNLATEAQLIPNNAFESLQDSRNIPELDFVGQIFLSLQCEEDKKNGDHFNRNIISAESESLESLDKELVHYVNLLPSYDLASQLITIYFEYAHPCFPVFNKIHFMNEVKKIFKGKISEIDISEIFLINMVFTIASCTSIPSSSTEEVSSDTFLNICEQCSRSAFGVMSDLQILRALILIGHVTLCKPCLPGLWNISRLTSSLAIRLRLYKEVENIPQGHQTLALDMRRRLFWCTYMLDRYVCLCVSRPFAIEEAFITTDYFLEIDDQYIVLGNDVMRSFVSLKSYKTYSLIYCKYFRLISEIKREVYSPIGLFATQGIDKANEWKVMMRIKLDCVDDGVSQNTTVETNSLFCRDYLRLLFHQAICLMYRPNPYQASSDDDYKNMYFAGMNIINIFKNLSDTRRTTYKLINIQILFIGTIAFLYSIWKCPNIKQITDKKTINYNITVSAEVLNKMTEDCNLTQICGKLVRDLSLFLSDSLNEESEINPINERSSPSTADPMNIFHLFDDLLQDNDEMNDEIYENKPRGFSSEEANSIFRLFEIYDC